MDPGFVGLIFSAFDTDQTTKVLDHPTSQSNQSIQPANPINPIEQ